MSIDVTKIALFVIFALHFVQAMLSQPNELIRLSNEVEYSRNIVQIGLIHSTSEGFYVLEEERGRTEQVHLIYYDRATLSPQRKKSIDIGRVIQRDQQFAGVFWMGDRFVFLSNGYNDDRDRFNAYALVVDSLGNEIGNPVLIHSAERQERGNPASLRWILSPDKTTLYVFFEANEEDQSFEIKVYNREFDLMAEKNLTLPSDKDLVRVQHFCADNLRGIYMLSGDNPVKNTSAVQKQQIGKYVLYYYSFEYNTLKEYNVSLKDKQVVSVAYDLREDGSFIIGGYFSNDLSSEVSGIFVFELEPLASGIRNAYYSAFAKDFLKTFLSERELRNLRGIEHLYLDHLVLQKDGSLYMLGEQYYSTEQYISDMTTGRQLLETTFHYDDIVVTKISPQGKIQWTTHIPKQQYAYSNDHTCSYAFFTAADSLRLFFNDDQTNLHNTNDKLKSWYNAKEGITEEVSVNNEGQWKRILRLDNEKSGCVLNPTWGDDSGSACAITLGFGRGKTYRFGVL